MNFILHRTDYYLLNHGALVDRNRPPPLLTGGHFLTAQLELFESLSLHVSSLLFLNINKQRRQDE